MKFIMQLLREAGGDDGKAFTVVPSFGGYFRAVKGVEEYAAQSIVLSTSAGRLEIVGEGLTIEKYAEGDLFVRGDIKGVQLD